VFPNLKEMKNCAEFAALVGKIWAIRNCNRACMDAIVDKLSDLLHFASGLSYLHCVSKKNDNDVLRYNFNAHQQILIIFGGDIAE